MTQKKKVKVRDQVMAEQVYRNQLLSRSLPKVHTLETIAALKPQIRQQGILDRPCLPYRKGLLAGSALEA